MPLYSHHLRVALERSRHPQKTLGAAATPRLPRPQPLAATHLLCLWICWDVSQARPSVSGRPPLGSGVSLPQPFFWVDDVPPCGRVTACLCVPHPSADGRQGRPHPWLLNSEAAGAGVHMRPCQPRLSLLGGAHLEGAAGHRIVLVHFLRSLQFSMSAARLSFPSGRCLFFFSGDLLAQGPPGLRLLDSEMPGLRLRGGCEDDLALPSTPGTCPHAGQEALACGHVHVGFSHGPQPAPRRGRAGLLRVVPFPLQWARLIPRVSGDTGQFSQRDQWQQGRGTGRPGAELGVKAAGAGPTPLIIRGS